MTSNLITKIIQYANRFNISPALLMGLIEQESDFDENCLTYESNKGAYSIGLCQIMISAAEDMGFTSSGDTATDQATLLNIDANLYYGAKYLRSRMDTYSNLTLLDQVRCYNSGSPLSSDSPYYSDNINYGNNVLNYYAKWEDRFKFSKKGNFLTEILLSCFIGSMAIYLDAKLIK